MTTKVDACGNAVVATSGTAGWGRRIPCREARERRSGLARGGNGFHGSLDASRLAASGQAVRVQRAGNRFGNDLVIDSLVGRGSVTGTTGPSRRRRVGRVVRLRPCGDAGEERRRRLVVRIAVRAHRPGSAVNLRTFILVGGGARALAFSSLAVGGASGSIGRQLGMDEAAPLAVGARTGDPEGAANLGLVL